MPVTTPPKNGNNGFNWGRFSKTLSFWILIILIPVALIQLSGQRSDAATEIRYDFYRQQLESGNIAEVTVQGGKNVLGTFKEAKPIANKPVKKFTIQLPAANSPQEIELLAVEVIADLRRRLGALAAQLDERHRDQDDEDPERERLREAPPVESVVVAVFRRCWHRHYSRLAIYGRCRKLSA